MSVVAPTYRRGHALPAFVEPLLRESELHELVMAVDGSADGSVQWLESRRAHDGRLVVLDLPNRGVGATRQAGVEAASGDVILMLDDDVIASPGLVSGHRSHHARLEPKLVMGYMPNDWASLPPGRRGIARVYRRAYEGHCSRYVTDRRFVLHGFWGGNFSMPRLEFLRVGVQGLDIQRGQDDREFGLRCAKAGIEPVFDPFLAAEHLYDRDLAAYRRDMRIQGQSRRMIHEVHGDMVGPELSDDTEGAHVADAVGLGIPGPLRRLWPMLARDPLFGIVTGALTAAFGLGVRLRHLGTETQTARAIGSLETMRGVLDPS